MHEVDRPVGVRRRTGGQVGPEHCFGNRSPSHLYKQPHRVGHIERQRIDWFVGHVLGGPKRLRKTLNSSRNVARSA
jgi:hypothetical protein